MSKRLTLSFSATVTAGGESSMGPDLSSSALVDGAIHDKVFNVAGAASLTYQTVWEAAVDVQCPSFRYGAIIVDPDRARTSEKKVHVRVTTSTGSTYTTVVSSDFPFMSLNESALITTSITLAKIEVGNIAGGVVTTDDVVCRLILWK